MDVVRSDSTTFHRHTQFKYIRLIIIEYLGLLGNDASFLDKVYLLLTIDSERPSEAVELGINVEIDSSILQIRTAQGEMSCLHNHQLQPSTRRRKSNWLFEAARHTSSLRRKKAFISSSIFLQEKSVRM